MKRIGLAFIASLVASTAFGWTLDGDVSSISYVSIKNAEVAEANLLPSLSGGVDADGAATIEIDMASVETYVDIRNERMREHLFRVSEHPTAMLSAQLDLASLEGLEPGMTSDIEFDVTIAANDAEASYPVKAAVTHVSDDRVIVTSREPVIVYADDLGWDTGIAELQELAGLESIQLTVPVSFTLVFNR